MFQLDPIVRWLWPIPVAMFVVYPYLKRVTWLCHLWLGACLGLAPVGAWLAVTGTAPWEAWALFAAGRSGSPASTSSTRSSTSSTTARRGCTRGRRASASAASSPARGVFHAAPSLLLAAVGAGLRRGVFYWLGVVASPGCSLYEHSLVRPGDLRRLDAAFFTVNGVISVVFFVFVALDTLSEPSTGQTATA